MSRRFLCLCSPALAAKNVFNVLGANPGVIGGLFNQPKGVAVNTTGEGGVPAGTFYVVDGNNRRIQRFGPNGAFVSAWGWDVNSPDGDAGYEICTVAADCLQADGGTGAGELSLAGAMGITVDQASGNVYMSDQSNRRINVYSATGEFYGAFGWGALDGNVVAGNEFEFCTLISGCAAPNTTAGAQGGKLGTAIGGLAVDPSGLLYVADKTNRRVSVFKPILAGAKKAVIGAEFVRAFGWGVNTGAAAFEICAVAANCKAGATTAPGNNPGQFGASGTTSPADIAIDGSGNVYALDPANGRVQKFNSTPAPVIAPDFDSSAALAAAFGGNLNGIAYDRAADRLYVSGSEAKVTIVDTAPGTGALTVRAAGGNYKLSYEGQTTANIAATATAATVQTGLQALSTIGAGNVSVSGGPGSADGSTPYTIAFAGPLAGGAVSQITADTSSLTTGLVRVAEMDATGAAVPDGIHGQDLTIVSSVSPSLAVAPASAGGGIFFASISGGQRVFILNTPPTATLDEATNVTTTTATFSGAVDPTGGTVSCAFQYSLNQINWTEVAEPDCASLAPGGGPQAVTEDVSGLQPGARYYVRLVASRGSAVTVTSAIRNFTMIGVPPDITNPTKSEVSAEGATLGASINSRFQETKWHLEYLTQAEFEAHGFANAVKAPVPDAVVEAAGAPVPVTERITGLRPATTYRFRLVATNAASFPDGVFGPEETFTTDLASPTFGNCEENETLRTGASARLPDCRAWEQVSPVDKNGGGVGLGPPRLARAAEDGSALSFESPAGVPGGSGAQTFPSFLAKRGFGQWSTTGLLPNPSSGQAAGLLGWTPDFATVFDRARIFGGGTALLARATGNGVEDKIVPHTSPSPAYVYIGSSGGGDEVAFEAAPAPGSGGTALQLTTNAAPGKPNVYAWDRSERKLRLAGVLPDGTTPAEGSRAGRGGAVAGDYNYDNHIVGSSGAVFFNDRETGQLYLRLNPTEDETTQFDEDGNCEPDPVLACTIHISASRRTEGKAPDGTDSAGPQPATFMGANADGSTVTFLSREKLTNDATTGAEPDPPAIAKAEAAGGNVTLDAIEDPSSSLPFAREIAVDEAEEYVYWTDPDLGSIGRAKLNGSDFNREYVTGLDEPLGIAVIDEVGAKYIFWTERGPLDAQGKPQAGQGTIGRIDLDGVTDKRPSCYEGIDNPRSITVRSNQIYWTAPLVSDSRQGEIDSAEISCNQSSVENLLSPSFAANGDIVADGSHIFVSFLKEKGTPSFIKAYDLDGTFLTTILQMGDAENAESLPGLAVDGSYLYWTDPENGRIGRLDTSDLLANAPEPDFITEAGHAGDPAVAGTELFWSTNQKVPLNPGTDIYQLVRKGGQSTLTDLAPDTGDANGVEAQGVLGMSEDGSYVYFAANGVPDGVGNSPNQEGEEAEPGDCKGVQEAAKGVCNLYVAHDGRIDFIARLNAERLTAKDDDSGDAVNWAAGHIDVVKVDSDRSARVSANGQVLVFRSREPLTKYNNQGPRCLLGESISGQVPGPCLEFYRFDYDEMGLTCVTCDPQGATPEGPARLASMKPSSTTTAEAAYTLGRNLSRDGSRFFFETPDALVAADVNGEGGCPRWGLGAQLGSARACQDVYEWEAPGAGSCSKESPAYSLQNQGCIYLISTGKSPEATFFIDADLAGKNVFIYTFEQLVGQDTDSLLDAYDARVDGGLEAQAHAEAPRCVGETTCKAPPAPPPAPPTPGSSSFSGPADLQPQRAHKKKHKKRKHGKHRRRKHGGKAAKRGHARHPRATKSRGAGR